MPLYRWNSGALADYADGDIIVFANSLAYARKKVIKAAKKKWHDGDEYSTRKIESVQRDISEEPYILDDGVAFITGSA